jgi:hypothetical protein
MRSIAAACLLVILGVCYVSPLPAAQGKTGARWEYRVLTKDQILELGKKDLAAGLNKLGTEGWELVAVDGPYIFKRPVGSGLDGLSLEQLKGRLALAESDVEDWKDRAAWSERMVKKGYMSKSQADADRARLAWAEMVLDEVRQTLKKRQTEAKDR